MCYILERARKWIAITHVIVERPLTAENLCNVIDIAAELSVGAERLLGGHCLLLRKVCEIVGGSQILADSSMKWEEIKSGSCLVSCRVRDTQAPDNPLWYGKSQTW